MLDEHLRISILRNRFLERSNYFEEQIKLRNVTRKKITEIDRLKIELKKKEELITMKEFKNNELLSDLYCVKIDMLVDIILIGIKLVKLEISKTTINGIKKSIA